MVGINLKCVWIAYCEIHSVHCKMALKTGQGMGLDIVTSNNQTHLN